MPSIFLSYLQIIAGLVQGLLDMKEYKQVIVVRNDLKLPKGKLAVQVAHAAVMAAGKAKGSVLRRWKDGGQKKVVLRVDSLDNLIRLYDRSTGKRFPAVLMRDAGLTIVAPGTVTALGIGPAVEEDLDAITGHLKLV